MAKTRKQISFDLDTKEVTGLKTHYLGGKYNNAYFEIKKYLLSHVFEWIQGSGYHSIKILTYSATQMILDKMIEKHPYLNQCMRDCRITEIGQSSRYITPKMRQALQEQSKTNLSNTESINTKENNTDILKPSIAELKNKDYDDEYTR